MLKYDVITGEEIHDLITFYYKHPVHKLPWKLEYRFMTYSSALRYAKTYGYRESSTFSPSTWGNRVEIRNFD